MRPDRADSILIKRVNALGATLQALARQQQECARQHAAIAKGIADLNARIERIQQSDREFRAQQVQARIIHPQGAEYKR